MIGQSRVTPLFMARTHASLLKLPLVFEVLYFAANYLVVQEVVAPWFPFAVNISLVTADRERIFRLLLEFQRMETLG